MSVTLVVMAAGMGSRYGGLKQIDPVGPSGEIIIEYALYDAILSGFSNVVFIIKPELEEIFTEKISSKVASRINVSFAYQTLDRIPEGFSVPPNRVKPWGTAHAVYTATNLIKTPFVVINSDDFYGRESYKIMYNFLMNNPENESCLAGYRIENTLTEHGFVARGVCETDKNGYLTKITEQIKIGYYTGGIGYTTDELHYTNIPAGTFVSMNMFGFPKNFKDNFQGKLVEFMSKHGSELTSEFLLPKTVGELINEDKAKLKVLETNAKWYGVTYKNDKPAVESAINQMIDDGKYPVDLWGNI